MIAKTPRPLTPRERARVTYHAVSAAVSGLVIACVAPSLRPHWTPPGAWLTVGAFWAVAMWSGIANYRILRRAGLL